MKRRFMKGTLGIALAACMLAGCGGKGAEESKPAAGEAKEEQSQDSAADKAEDSDEAGTGESAAASGAEGEENEGTDSSVFPLEEPVTMSMFVFQATGTDFSQNLAWKYMEDMTNVHWELTTATSTDYVEKRGIGFSSGDYQEVYFKSGLGEGDAVKYASEGIVIPLNDLIDQYMPNLKAALDRYDVWKYVTSEDGNIYSLPSLGGRGCTSLRLFVNQPWMEKLQIESPKNWDEFVEMLRAFKNGDPNGNGEADEFPLFLTSGTIDFLLPYYGIAYDWNTNASYPDGKLSYYPTSEEYKGFLKAVAELKAEGLINEYVEATWDDQAAHGQTEDTLGCFLQYGSFLTVGTEKDEDYPVLEPWYDTLPSSTGVGFGGVVITDKCQYPELVAQWADYFYSEEGSRLVWMGVEGESYFLNDDGTYTWNTDGTYGDDMSQVRSSATLYGDLPCPGCETALFTEGQTNPEEVFLNEQGKLINSHLADTYPRLSWTEEELERRATYTADINPYILQYEAQVVNGEVDLESTWDDFVKTLEEMGVEDLNAIDQAAVDRFYGAE